MAHSFTMAASNKNTIFDNTKTVKIFLFLTILCGFPPAVYRLFQFIFDPNYNHWQVIAYYVFFGSMAFLAIKAVLAKDYFTLSQIPAATAICTTYILSQFFYDSVILGNITRGLFYVNLLPSMYGFIYVVTRSRVALAISFAVLFVFVSIIALYFLLKAPFHSGRPFDDFLLSLAFGHGTLIVALFQVAAFREHYAERLTLARAALSEAEIHRAMEEKIEAARSDLAIANRNATAGVLAAAIAHELNQPLAAIVANAGATSRWLSSPRPNTKAAKNAAEELALEAHRAGEILSGIRQLLKRTVIDLTAIDVRSLLSDTVTLLTPDARSRNIRLTLNAQRVCPPCLGQKAQIQQVFVNLIVNALDSVTESAHEEKCIDIIVEPTTDQMIMIVISDSGQGLDDAIIDKIFDALYTTKPHGTGMGLPICRAIVEAHGGTITARNGAQRGAEFIVRLPVSPL